MRPSFRPRLINDPFSDPGLYIPFLFERKALMFDLGSLDPLSPRDLLKLTHVFVTHTHMDHFIGFDALLRIFLGREKELHLFGPPSFFERVEGKMAGYTWNLVTEYENDLFLRVTEIHPEKRITRIYSCRDGFRQKGIVREEPFSGVALNEPAFHVEAALLDHRVPCLGLSLVENFSVNIIKEELKNMDLPVGPWLNRFKAALYEKKDPASEFLVTWEKGGGIVKEQRFILGELSRRIARISPGQKITYVTDMIGSPDNYAKVLKLALKADHLFIEAAFLDCDKSMARQKYHLTAREAGELARKAAVKNFSVFHFSPRYSDRLKEIQKEAMEGYLG